VDLLRRGSSEPDAEGRVLSVTPESAGWHYVGFSAVRLRARERRSWSLGGREVCVVLLGGPCVLRAGGTTLDDLSIRQLGHATLLIRAGARDPGRR
jgi:5-deoxy-glucuronate isomerase